MDLSEIVKSHKRRHPWEHVRIDFIRKIIKYYVPNAKSILDIGCGDGFCGSKLVAEFSPQEYCGLDINLTSRQIEFYNKQIPQIKFFNNYSYFEGKKFDLVLLLDVIEHIENDREFVCQIANEHLFKKSQLLITVPAFPSIYGFHDSILGHHRRYSQEKLKSVIRSAHCQELGAGYMFSSLLIIRSISVLLERISLQKKPDYSGVGQWNGGPLLSKCIENALTIDNQILFLASRLGFLIPGLSLWILCEKQQ